MYTHPTSRKSQTIRQVLIYVLMTLTVVTIVFLLVLYMIGYRFDRAEGTIEQGGLVQLNSIPSGATITINGARLGATTSAKTTLAPGSHTFTMARNGYKPWQKTVELRRGSILWLNYARLIPTNLTVQNVAPLPGAISSEASPNREKYALTTQKNEPSVTIATIEGDKPELRQVVLPEPTYTKPKDAASESYRIAEWDHTSRFLLVEHRYDDTNEWIVVDTDDPAKSKNITTVLGIKITGIQFSPEDNNLVYVLMDGDVRRIDLGANTISAPLVRNAAEFSIYDNTTIVYATKVDEATKSRSVGYRTENASAPRVLRTFSDDGSHQLHVSIAKYYSQPFIAIAYGNAVEILTGSLPRSDSEDALSLKAFATMSTLGPIQFLTNKTDGRFFIAQHNKSFSVYDLELENVTTTVLRGDTVPDKELRWLDGYSMWSGFDGTLRLTEFDGANQHDIMPIVPGQTPALTKNNRYLYAPTIDDKGAYHLSRVRLILP